MESFCSLNEVFCTSNDIQEVFQLINMGAPVPRNLVMQELYIVLDQYVDKLKMEFKSGGDIEGYKSKADRPRFLRSKLKEMMSTDLQFCQDVLRQIITVDDLIQATKAFNNECAEKKYPKDDCYGCAVSLGFYAGLEGPRNGTEHWALVVIKRATEIAEARIKNEENPDDDDDQA
jgi:hypothetical protein